ncbi:hypothetical protein Ae717Ps2_6733 [Pseudonocardia sp. Ae717_Ps2]|uniref:hypothetical protein n=1 Tax=Pseudonocardia sp. Ae717_Ps2 TaxID=1885573 RepID=UPI00094AA8C6|nr:hypothetical protein [Pseudonocardia sp. Ae717_Ps2]OLM27896.1 hypothetical protein Ae717Ps2_7114 [Pseudonocardia sp. Ae717_Ps2]OLM28096.1 hypothetical protein Ae717Ps2_6835c [Pseudonocardia sp. Ae717_Ps2]OLM28105.1 hypothetical protein Ae717Ps2_6733 [Pseudonocardia sp. Ae717_Ps2]
MSTPTSNRAGRRQRRAHAEATLADRIEHKARDRAAAAHSGHERLAAAVDFLRSAAAAQQVYDPQGVDLALNDLSRHVWRAGEALIEQRRRHQPGGVERSPR